MSKIQKYLKTEFKDLLDQIKDDNLKQKTLDYLEFMTEQGKANNVDWNMPFTLNFSFASRYTLLHHTKNVTKIALAAAEIFEKTMDITIKWDELIVAGLIHDAAKLMESKKDSSGNYHKDTDYFKMFRHPSLGAMYAKKFGFPDSICHIILVHASKEGDQLLRSLEAQILHRADYIYYGGLRSHMGIK